MLGVTGNAAKPCLSGRLSHGWVAPWCSLVILSWHTVLMPPVLMGTFHSCISSHLSLSSVLLYWKKSLWESCRDRGAFMK